VKSDLIDVVVQMHAETEKAVLVSDDGDKDKAVWLPKSQIEIDPSMKERSKGAAMITLPEWLAKDKGLI
jgi:DNA-directed RNA polymerase alpha subunit